MFDQLPHWGDPAATRDAETSFKRVGLVFVFDNGTLEEQRLSDRHGGDEGCEFSILQ